MSDGRVIHGGGVVFEQTGDAGLAVGFWKDYDELRANWGKDREWTPKMGAKVRKSLYAGWKKAVTRTFDWVE